MSVRSVSIMVDGVESLAAARRFTAGALDLFGLAHHGGSVDDLLLAVTELASNGLALDAGEVSITLRRAGSDEEEGARVRAEVRDHGFGMPAVPDEPVDLDNGADGGMGLCIVERLSTRWGVEQFLPGKIVWFELALPS